MRHPLSRLARSNSGAVAPIVALSLLGLIACGGIAFDYSQLASLDTELQQAADQAALAGATQLNGQTGAIERATAAAQALLANETRFANDGSADGRAVTIPNVVFYETRDDAEADTDGFTDATRFKEAHFVRVAVTTRAARYALTPIVGLIASPNLAAEAIAGLGSAICKSPPLLICNPDESGSNSDFDAAAYVGRGIRLISVGGGPGGWAPGNFGYLDTGGGSNGVPGLQEGLGWVTPPGDCLSATGVDTKPGGNVPATDAINTRFDIYDSNNSCQSGGTCPASINSVKDVVRPANASGNNACKLHNSGWQEAAAPYRPSSASAYLPTSVTPGAMGHPRDLCHAFDDSCAKGRIGNAIWDRDAYFRTNYGWTHAQWQSFTGLAENAAKTQPTRYQVYSWEIAQRGNIVGGVTVLGPRPPGATGATRVSYGLPRCSASAGYGSGTVPGPSVVDRRRISVAVANCSANGVNGNSEDVPVVRWIEVFLVEPSLARGGSTATVAGTNVSRVGTNQGDLYVEVIGETQSGGAGATAGQVVKRDVPYLVK
ncbi:MAG TPA: pilus assembly protein TadG-related protein [Sphingomicrobium sp.]|nr:pilus assembly protein TadG-related protein [Sphingomicrobium sp.]